ncbi:IclR family transcriptional regulator [Kushneria marisflavi]|uniref:HTH-type transcriptional repressor AllR n=1 Tax=Kushneria marisflavi TaxID=157779 RepID=A0A240UNL8_9GAMM|nr:IclR family transcriptional regulator [Kushneria marisflavi]ART63081.1 transcriptional regulator [Kushneria marisflavi]RKD84671.1 IclR family transcriptional regulator [Kushneria marisflavi]
MIQSIERALHILECIAHAGGNMRLQQIAEATELKTTTAHNILKTLGTLGYVRRRPNDTRYYLGDRILNLARIAGDDSGLRRRLRPRLEAMAEASGETVFLAVPSGDEVFFLDAIESSQILRASSQQGERTPMEGSAIGLLFLAFMPMLRQQLLSLRASRIGPGIVGEVDRIAARGYALDEENYLPGVNAVAVPWLEDGELRAGFGIAGPSVRLSSSRLETLAALMSRLCQD